MSAPHTPPDQQRWNDKYRSKGPETRPLQAAVWLSQHEDLLTAQTKGPALDIACGNGRNSYYLADRGFEVDAIDISDVAIDWVRQQVQTTKAAVHPHCLNLETAPFPRTGYQVIVNFFYLQRSLFDAIQSALVPGGLLFFETFYREVAEAQRSSMNPHFLLGPNELMQAFSTLRILHYEEQIHASPHQGQQKSVARLIARKS